jgi:hypothetical protein
MIILVGMKKTIFKKKVILNVKCYLTFRYLKDNQSAYIENILCNRKEVNK